MGEKGYKAFKPGLICKDKQYQENTTFEEEGAENICLPGMMHYCNNPFDCLNYYPLVDEDGKFSDFAEVKALGNIVRGDDKSATNKLHIGAKLGLKGFIKAAINFTIEKTTFGTSRTLEDIPSNDEDSAQIGSSGYYAQIGSSGYSAKIGSSGDSAKIGSSGDSAQIDSTGKNSVIMAAGHCSMVKATAGSWITLAEYEKNEDGVLVPIYVKTEYVDGKRIKENVFYTLRNKEFVEVKEAE